MPEGACSVCAKQGSLRRGRCYACYMYVYRHGFDKGESPKGGLPIRKGVKKHTIPLRECLHCRQMKPARAFPAGTFMSPKPQMCLECGSLRLAARGPKRQKKTQWSDLDLEVRVAKYGITAEQYKGLHLAQGGACPICQRSAVLGELVVDHDHATGAVRGLLCHTCNVGLGQLGDTKERLEFALNYLSTGPTLLDSV